MRIVLLGGGLSHIHYIRNKAKDLNIQVEIVLVNDKPQFFYAPAFEDVLMGRCTLNEAVIDLRKICTLAGVTFIQSEVVAVDSEKKLIKFSDRANLQFDFLSIEDIGVTNTHNPRGYLENGFYVRDYIQFFTQLKELEAGLAKARPHRFRVAVVGGGELGVAISRYLPERLKKYAPKLQWEIFEKQDCLLSDYQNQIRKVIEKELKDKDVLWHTQFPVGDVFDSKLVNTNDPKKTFEADIIFFTSPQILPSWVNQSSLPLKSDGVFDAHPHFVLKNTPFVLASGASIGLKTTEKDQEDHALAIEKIVNHQEIAPKKEFNKIKKKDIIYAAGKAMQVNWGFVKQSEKVYQDHQVKLKTHLQHLRAVKEQMHAQMYPLIEENTYVDKLKKRLMLDLTENEMSELFSQSLQETHSIGGWFEREYKDVFNDHYLSSFYTGLDLIDQSYLQNGTPEYLRLYVSAPSRIKDVEILSQIIVGAYRAGKDLLKIKIHICGQAMNTVQFSLGARGLIQKKEVPEPMAYIALTRPMGLYGLLSQQGKSIWQGEWLSGIGHTLNKSHDFIGRELTKTKFNYSVFQLSDLGLVNDLVRQVGTEGWKICVNISQLPRWSGVDEILKEQPMDELIDRNWQRGFRYWTGRGEEFPESQYLLWEPHLLRPAACMLVAPEDIHALKQTFEENNETLYFVGYVERTIQKEQTSYKLSDWAYQSPMPIAVQRDFEL